MKAKAHILTDLGYGDSGKGSVTDYICRTELEHSARCLVVRLQGGHQIGHTVKSGNFVHEFHNFGSGTLQGVPTWYGPETTCYPGIRWVIEYDVLKDGGFNPVNYYDPGVMITTVFDVLFNRWQEDNRGDNRHGSVGLGFNATIERNQKLPFTVIQLLASDFIIKQKLQAIYNYYLSIGVPKSVFENVSIDDELQHLKEFIKLSELHSNILTFPMLFQLLKIDTLIFESNQGLLLDQKYGDFPHVTRSNCTCEPALEFISKYQKEIKIDQFYFYDISRVYHTRHGNGPFREEPIDLIHTEYESNHFNPYQQNFKKSVLQYDLLEYAVMINSVVKSKYVDLIKASESVNQNILVFTCYDQIYNFEILVYEGPEFRRISYEKSRVTDIITMLYHVALYNRIIVSDNPMFNPVINKYI